MRIRRFVAVAALVGVVAGCGGPPSRSGLATKLEQRNDLTSTEATCVADGLYDGMPNEEPPIRALSTTELRSVAKPENAGKVPPEVVTILREVVTACVPTDVKPAGS